MQAIWTILYDIASEERERYLAWFHDVHIPEKLARPGYTWAAHYACVDNADAATTGFIALFGAESSRVLHSPSPAQIKPTQTELTRSMMGLRIEPRVGILIEEWRCVGRAGCGLLINDQVDAPAIRLDCLDAVGADEDLHAWCAQQHAPRIGGSDGCTAVHKLRASSGALPHAVLQQFRSVAHCTQANEADMDDAWTGRVEGYVARPAGAPRIARRIWPLVDD
ncbi:MAG: hypothetical protein KDK91_09135 [Gammaproteobacteria bacterium]|nr:hypothetical protein [Gammaproteobacteria bacterium]